MRPLDEYPHCEPDRCNVCGQDIIWVRSISGNVTAVDPEPVPGGELVIITGIIQPPLDGLSDLIFGPNARYRHHVRTCHELEPQERQEGYEKAMSTAPHPHEVSNCKCGASMFFAPSAKGNDKKIPLCAQPHPVGNIFLNEKHEAVYVSQKNPAPPGTTLYQSHFADCPFSEQFRTPKK